VLRIDLSRVTYLSVVAARALVEGTQDYRRGGGSVQLVAPPTDIEWFIRALGVDQHPRVYLSERAGP
jgi:anti-anti-sigma regulatory factor